MDDLFSDIAGLFSGTESRKEKDKPKEKEPAEIKAKRLDEGGKPEEKKQPDDPPYKIYPSPMVREETPVSFDPYESAREQSTLSATSNAFTGWEGRAAGTVDISKPPPLPAHVRAELEGASAGKQAPKLPTLAPVVSENAKPRSVPPISALPKQFFPILPMGALPDTPPQLLPVASNAPLEGDHAYVRRAIIVIHDMQRNAADGVATLMTLSGADAQETLIVAPQFPLALDILRFAAYLPDDGKYVARWPIQNGWNVGGESILAGFRHGVSSFTAADLLLMYVSDRRRFPSLERVVIAGHGMGGDFAHRYAAAGQAPDLLRKDGIDVRFVVANPSSYLYFTALRPTAEGPAFLMPPGGDCPANNDYPYGLFALGDYARRVGASEMRLRYPERKVVYLVGNRIVNDPYLDQSCAARLQGKDRLARGQNYARHLMQSFGDVVSANQTFVFVPQAGYDPVSLYGSYCGMETLFGAGNCGK